MDSKTKLFALIALALLTFCINAQDSKGYITLWPGFIVDSTGISFQGVASTDDSTRIVKCAAADTTYVALGVLANVSNKDVEGVQLSCLANVSNCHLKGLQLTTLSNYNGSSLKGAQICVVSNVSVGDLTGLQLAAYSNVTKGNLTGTQVSSFSNVAIGNATGAQISGFMNIAHGELSVVQSAGFINLAKTIKGPQIAGYINIASTESKSAQVAGYFNYTPYSRGIQLAGFSNVATKENSGVQLSGFFNYAGLNSGTQLSFINYADSSSGIPIGFFSFVKKGYHVLELSGTETFPVNIAFKTGVKRFYNIFEMGFGEDDIQLGYGLGTIAPLGKRLDVSFDLTASHIVGYRNAHWEDDRYMARFAPSLNFQAFKKVGVAIGPSINLYVAETNTEGISRNLSTYSFASGNEGDFSYQAWIGGRLALRFF